MLAFNVALMLVGILFPPNLYSKLMEEPDYMFLNLELAVFVLMCTVSFIMGYKLFHAISLTKNRVNDKINNRNIVLFPLVIWSFLTVYSLFLILLRYPELIQSLGTLSASHLRAEISLHLKDVMSGAPIILSEVIWWAIYRMRDLEIKYDKRLFFYRAGLVLCSIIVIAMFTVKMSRMELLPFIFGAIISYNYLGNATSFYKKNSLQLQFVMFIIIGFSVFIAMSAVRGYSLSEEFFQVFAYGPASFNRLAAILSGRLHFYGGNTGIYVSNFQGQIPILKDFINVYSFLGQPSLNDAWQRDFIDVHNAGLNSHYTFPTVYGSVFTFFGWLSPLYFLAIGYAYRLIIRSLELGRIFGIIFFPLALFSLFFWFGWNFILSYNFTASIITVVMLSLYVRIFNYLLSPRTSPNKSLDF